MDCLKIYRKGEIMVKVFDKKKKGKKNKHKQTKKLYNMICRAFSCWTTRIRTWTNRTKTCCATITP